MKLKNQHGTALRNRGFGPSYLVDPVLRKGAQLYRFDRARLLRRKWHILRKRSAGKRRSQSFLPEAPNLRIHFNMLGSRDEINRSGEPR
jgi:hypothetical protein